MVVWLSITYYHTYKYTYHMISVLLALCLTKNRISSQKFIHSLFSPSFSPSSLARGTRTIKTVQLAENEVRGLCLKAKDIFLSQPILLELEAPLKICGECMHGNGILTYM